MNTQARNTSAESRTVFQKRIAVLAVLLGVLFLTVVARLFQLQILRHEQYAALTNCDRGGQRLVPSTRAQITDRYGEILADDQPVFDIAVRVDQLKLQRVTLDDAKKERALDLSLAQRKERAVALASRLAEDPFIARLAQTLQVDRLELAGHVFTALDNVARKPAWAAPGTAQTIARGVNEDVWLALRSVHEDQLRNTALLNRKEQKEALLREPPFPGLQCLVSTRRAFPKGKFAGAVLGCVGELSEADDRQLRGSGILIENAEGRQLAWVALRDKITPAQVAALQALLGEDPREIDDFSRLLERLSILNEAQRMAVAQAGLSDALKWTARPPRIKLNEAELLYLGVNMPVPATHNSLADQVVGESGIERFYNDRLRGKHALKIKDGGDANSAVETAVALETTETKESGAFALTLSCAWQEAVENALNSQEHRGAFVVLDIRDGAVMALASKPGFDPNVFTPPRNGAARQEQIKALLDDPEHPLLNRAISGEYPLGSIMKSLIAAVALEKGLLKPDETFECPGYIKEGGQIFHCDSNRAHGTVNVYKGLRCSCNVMFHQVGARIGVENLGPFAKLILGKRTGIDLPAESTGVYPDRAWRMKTFPTNPQARIWTRGNDFQLAIGQGQMNSTVLQAALLMSTIANGGTVVTPHLWLDAPPSAAVPLGVRDSILSIVRRGLDECVNVGTPGERGTCYTPFHSNGELAVRVAGKTSTAEHKKGAPPHAWFAGYVPADHPRYAFAIVLEEAGHGGAVAGPVAYQMLREIYGTRQNPNPHPGEKRQDLARAEEP